MPTMKSHISWTDSTWNPTTGCTKVSAGCDHCYAEYIVERRWKLDFAQVRVHPDRLAAVHRFKPLPGADGLPVPRRVFVNSMSDLMHKDIPDAFRDDCFAAMERKSDTVFQVLTKRPMSMARYVANRYGAGNKVPHHIWLGASVEDNRVAGRIDTMRAMKAATPCTVFLSVEPLIGLPDRHDYTAIDQVLVGGESGVGARSMEAAWASTAIWRAHAAGAAVWFKQWGLWSNNPLYRVARGPMHLDKVRQAIEMGEGEARIETGPKGNKVVAGEKGGATIDGKIWHQMPPVFDELTKRLRAVGRA